MPAKLYFTRRKQPAVEVCSLPNAAGWERTTERLQSLHSCPSRRTLQTECRLSVSPTERQLLQKAAIHFSGGCH